LLWEAQVIDHVESVEGWLGAKLDALLCHRSQWRSTMGIHADPAREQAAFAERIRRRATEHGSLAGLAAGEGFKRIDEL
jgi:hypothetical protein